MNLAAKLLLKCSMNIIFPLALFTYVHTPVIHFIIQLKVLKERTCQTVHRQHFINLSVTDLIYEISYSYCNTH